MPETIFSICAGPGPSSVLRKIEFETFETITKRRTVFKNSRFSSTVSEFFQRSKSSNLQPIKSQKAFYCLLFLKFDVNLSIDNLYWITARGAWVLPPPAALTPLGARDGAAHFTWSMNQSDLEPKPRRQRRAVILRILQHNYVTCRTVWIRA